MALRTVRAGRGSLMSAAIAVLALAAPAPAGAEDPQEDVSASMHKLRIVVPSAIGMKPWGTVELTRAARRAITAAVGEPVPEEAYLAAQEKLGLKGESRFTLENMARAGREAGAHYVLAVGVTRKGWLHTAHARLVNTTNAEVQMDFRSEYYVPKTEAKDRGSRIGGKTAQKLEILLRAKATPLDAPGGAVAVTPGPGPGTPGPFGAEGPGPGDKPAGGTPEATPPVGGPAGEGPAAGDGAVAMAGSGDSGSGSGGGGGSGADDLSAEFAAAFSDTGSGGGDSEAVADEGGWAWTVRGWLGTTYQGFLHDNLRAGIDRSFVKIGIRSTLDGRLTPTARLRVLPLVELDVTKSRLHRVVLEEAFFEKTFDFFELRVGFDALTWGSATTVNIVDVVNARDLTEGFVDAPKIGQPMIAGRFLFGSHSLTLLYLTPFVEPQLPKTDTGFSPFPDLENAPAPGKTARDLPKIGERTLLAGKGDEWHPQAAARLALSLGGVDVRGSYFFGYGRNPIVHNPSQTVVYPLVHNVSTDGQFLWGQATFKWELASTWHVDTDRMKRPPITNPNGQPAAPILLPDQRITWIAGVEYNLENFIGGSTILPVVEFVGDSDSKWFTDERPPDDVTRFFQNHLIYGFNWTFENRVGSKVTAIDLMDLANPSDHVVQLSYEERWFHHFTFAVGGRWVFAQAGHKFDTLKGLSGVYTQLRLNY